MSPEKRCGPFSTGFYTEFCCESFARGVPTPQIKSLDKKHQKSWKSGMINSLAFDFAFMTFFGLFHFSQNPWCLLTLSRLGGGTFCPGHRRSSAISTWIVLRSPNFLTLFFSMLDTSQKSPPKFFFQSVAKNFQRGDPSKNWIRAESAPPQSTTSFQSPAQIGLNMHLVFDSGVSAPTWNGAYACVCNVSRGSWNAPTRDKVHF